LWILTVLQERSFWLQQPWNGVELGDRGTTNPVPSCEAPPMQGSLPHQDPSPSPPAKGGCAAASPGPPHSSYLVPEFGNGRIACWQWPWQAAATVPLQLNVAFSHRASFSLCSKSIPCGEMDVAFLSWVPWAKPTWDLPEWAAYKTTPKWLSCGFLLLQNILLFFISLPCAHL
jgi:hypothetical protein